MSETIEIQKPLSPGVAASDGGGGGALEMPLAGFWRRAGAFMIDYVILHLLAFGWFKALLPMFLAWPLMLPVVSALVATLYLTLLNGPVGKGRTVGKQVLGLITRQLDGKPLDWSAAFMRSTIQCVLLIVAVAQAILPELVEPGPGLYQVRLAATALLITPALVFFAVNAAIIGVRTDKRGFHELASGSFTFRVDHADTALPYLLSIPPEGRKRNWQVSLGLMVALLIVFETSFAFRSKEDEKQSIKFLEEFRVECGVEGFTANPIKIAGARKDEATSGFLTSETQAVADATTKPLICQANTNYVRMGRVDDDALREEIAQRQLTNWANEWVQERWDSEEMPEAILARRDRLINDGYKCVGHEVAFYEYLKPPWLISIVHVRPILYETFPVDWGEARPASSDEGNEE